MKQTHTSHTHVESEKKSVRERERVRYIERNLYTKKSWTILYNKYYIYYVRIPWNSLKVFLWQANINVAGVAGVASVAGVAGVAGV